VKTRLTVAQADRLRRVAELRGTTLGQELRRAVFHYLTVVEAPEVVEALAALAVVDRWGAPGTEPVSEAGQ
jgi:hypothetical protein